MSDADIGPGTSSGPSARLPRWAIHPLTTSRWSDFEELFGQHGAYCGCWCMWWRLTRREFQRNQGDGNRHAMKSLVDGGAVPGLLAYDESERGQSPRAAGWCSVAPREEFGSLERSRMLRRIDESPVWSIVCFFVREDFRGRGVARALVRGAVEYAQSHGATIVEAYPCRPAPGARVGAPSAYMGTDELFRSEGFIQVGAPSARSVVMRRYLGKRVPPGKARVPTPRRRRVRTPRRSKV